MQMKLLNKMALVAAVTTMVSHSFAQRPSSADSRPPETLERLEVVGSRTVGVFTYAKAYAYLTKFAALPSKSKIDLVVYLRPREGVNIKPSEVKLNIQGDTYLAKVNIRDDWRLRIPMSQAAVDEGADFVINQDIEKFRRPVQIEILAPPQSTVPLRFYFDALDEVLAAERKLMLFFMPLKTTIIFVFTGNVKPRAEVFCEGQTVEVFESEAKSLSVPVTLDQSWKRRECQIKFSPAPPTYSIPVHGK